MKSSLSRFLFTIVFLSLSSCNIDEIPPEVVSDVRGWFTIESNNIGVNLAWSEVSDDDIDKYIIFKVIWKIFIIHCFIAYHLFVGIIPK